MQFLAAPAKASAKGRGATHRPLVASLLHPRVDQAVLVFAVSFAIMVIVDVVEALATLLHFEACCDLVAPPLEIPAASAAKCVRFEATTT